MEIITRAQWGARPPKSRTTVSPSAREYFVVHHSGAPATQTVRAIQDWCMNEPPHGRGFSDIDYNHLVRATTGEIYEGRGWDVVGAHTTNYNTTGVGVCLIGDDQASDAAKASVRWLYEQYSARCGKALKIRGHKDLATTGTDCPGDHVYAWVHAGMPVTPTQEDDMPLTQQDKIDIARAVWNQEVYRTGRSAHDTLFGDMQAGLVATAAKTDAVLKNVVADDGERDQILAAIQAERTAVLAAVGQVDEELFAKLSNPGTPDAQVAAALVSLLGARKNSVLALMQG